MELAGGRALFSRFVYGDPDDGTAYETDFARVLEEAVVVMRRRQAALRGVTRLHEPTVEEPLIVVVIDELASLTAYVQDRDAKKRIASALSLLLSQGPCGRGHRGRCGAGPPQGGSLGAGPVPHQGRPQALGG